MKLISDALGLICLIALVAWGVLIASATPEKKAVVVCRPVHYIVTNLGYLESAATGTRPPQDGSYPWQDDVLLFCLKANNRLLSATSN